MAVCFTTAWFAVFKKLQGEELSVLKDESNLNRIHILCQITNAFIQNKIGSGFDIACAIFGSQIYRRFTNKLEIMDLVDYINGTQISEIDLKVIDEKIANIESTFDYKLKKFILPANLQLNMVDVNSGSDTKVLVSAVLKWEKNNRENLNQMFSGYYFQ